jgi:hypothetical protein
MTHRFSALVWSVVRGTRLPRVRAQFVMVLATLALVGLPGGGAIIFLASRQWNRFA